MVLEVLWEEKQTKGSPSGGLPWREATILVASSAFVEAQPPGEGVNMQDAKVPALLRVKC